MKTTQAIPYLTLLVIVAIVVTGSISVRVAWTTGVQASYFFAIATLLAALTQLFFSATLHASKRFGAYWESGYPILFSILLAGYVIFKSIHQPTYLAINILAIAFGWGIASKLPRPSFRFAPLAFLFLFLFLEEALGQTHWRHWVTCIIVGILLYAIRMHRRNQRRNQQ